MIHPQSRGKVLVDGPRVQLPHLVSPDQQVERDVRSFKPAGFLPETEDRMVLPEDDAEGDFNFERYVRD